MREMRGLAEVLDRWMYGRLPAAAPRINGAAVSIAAELSDRRGYGER